MVKYLIDGNDFETFGVYVSESFGIIGDFLPVKQKTRFNWPEYHGEVVSQELPKYEAREIELKCFLVASNELDFAQKATSFLNLFRKSGTRRLLIDVVENKPLVYEVYMTGGGEMKKEWQKSTMIGTFALKLREPMPVKRVVNFTSSPASITLTSQKFLTIFWGDGTMDANVAGENITITHNYSKTGTHTAIIAGVIEEVSNFSTNGTILWSIL